MDQGSGIALSCGVGCRRRLDLMLLWLWGRPAAVAPVQPLVWELPYADPKKQEKKKKSQILKSEFLLSFLAVYFVFYTFS